MKFTLELENSNQLPKFLEVALKKIISNKIFHCIVNKQTKDNIIPLDSLHRFSHKSDAS